MFRDSRGVVHTVSSPDPLADLPAGAARALQDALLPAPPEGAPLDVGSVLTTAELVRELLDRWQDAFFDCLPDEVDLDEEARFAAEAGLSLDDLESEVDQELDPFSDGDDAQDLDDEHDHGRGDADPPAGGRLRAGRRSDLATLLDAGPDDPRLALPEPLVTALERELLLLPVRVRLEALVAADDLVQEWCDLVADREKLLGHLVLAHGRSPTDPRLLEHELLAGEHARLHAAHGPGHEDGRA